MPSWLQNSIAWLGRFYPFLSGMGTIANSSLLRNADSESQIEIWSKVDGGEVLARLDDYVGRSAFYFGDIDPKISQIVTRCIEPGDVAFDIGANIGIYSLLLSKLVGSQGSVFCFEPNTSVYQSLERAMNRTGRNNASIINAALGAEPGSLMLSVPPGNVGAGSLINTFNIPASEQYLVPVLTLDLFVAQHGIDRIDFIKMDVEGFEQHVLDGATMVIKNLRPTIIVFENNLPITNPTRETLLVSFSDASYDLYSLQRSLLSLKLCPVKDLSTTTAHDFVAICRDSKSIRVRASLDV